MFRTCQHNHTILFITAYICQDLATQSYYIIYYCIHLVQDMTTQTYYIIYYIMHLSGPDNTIILYYLLLYTSVRTWQHNHTILFITVYIWFRT